MKVVIATPLYPPEIGGPATYAQILVDALGHDVVLVKFSDVRRLWKIIRHFTYFLKVFKAAKDADIVFALDPVSVGLPAMWAAYLAKKKFVVKIVGDYAWEQGNQRFGVKQNLDDFVQTEQSSWIVRRLQNIQTRVARHATRVIVPGQYLKEIVTAWGVSDKKIQVIHNSVTLPPLGILPESVTHLSPPLVVSVGRLVPWKEFDGVIDAVLNTNASLVVIGEGPLYSRVTANARQKLGERALFTGVLSRPDTLAVMKKSDVFVLNSSYEGFSHVLVEAIFLGKAIIATNIPGNKEIIDGTNGILVNVGDTEELTNALNKIFSDPVLKSNLERRAAQSATNFSKEAMVLKTKELLFIT